jgi:hypothetical protein
VHRRATGGHDQVVVDANGRRLTTIPGDVPGLRMTDRFATDIALPDYAQASYLTERRCRARSCTSRKSAVAACGRCADHACHGATRAGTGHRRFDAAGLHIGTALRIALGAAAALGAQTELITGRDLMLPIYDTEAAFRSPGAGELVAPFAAATRWSSPHRATTARSPG